jgi:hypothetical protein
MAVLAANIELLRTLSMLADTNEILADSELSARSCVDVVGEVGFCDDASCAHVNTARYERRKKVMWVGNNEMLFLQYMFLSIMFGRVLRLCVSPEVQLRVVDTTYGAKGRRGTPKYAV